MCQDPSEIASSFEVWWDRNGEKFFAVKSEEMDVLDDDLEFEEVDFDVKGVEEIDEQEDLEGDMPDHEKIQTLEDRSRIQECLEAMQKECSEAHSEIKAAEDQSPQMHETKDETMAEQDACNSKDGLDFGAILDEFGAGASGALFDFSNAASRGQKACLDRMATMKPRFIEFVKLAKEQEGLLSRAQISGERSMESQKSEWNFMMSELARAKQYAKFKGLRGSRLSSWMQAQEDLKMMASDKGVLPDDEGWEEGLLRIDVFRPASAKSLQYVIYKSGSDMVEYNIGIILSIYRGSVSKAQATDRRMTISKPLPVATPSNLVARVRVLQLDKLDGKVMVASGISKQSVVHVEDICGEIGVVETGVKGGVIYTTINAVSLQICQALQAGDLIFGKDDRKAKRRRKELDSEFEGFSIKSFPKSDSGDAMIESLGPS